MCEKIFVCFPTDVDNVMALLTAEWLAVEGVPWSSSSTQQSFTTQGIRNLIVHIYRTVVRQTTKQPHISAIVQSRILSLLGHTA